MDKISRLSSKERKFLANTRLLDWRPEGKEIVNFVEELSYMKHLMLKLNSKLKIGNQKVSESKMDYYIALAEVVIL
jgi:hypothetical protein